MNRQEGDIKDDVHLNLNVRGMKPSATVAINEYCNRLREQGRQVFKLGLGQSPFPVPDSVVDELKANAHQKDYLEVRGLAALREAVAAHLRRSQGVTGHADDVLIGPGSKELMFLLQIVFYGDLLIPTPAWVSYAPQAAIVGRHVTWLNTERSEGWLLTPERLNRVCREDPSRPRVLVLNYPSNPTGQTWDEEALRALAAVTAKYGIIVLSDEIYGGLHYEGRHASIARYYPERTIISGGLSKWCGAGGWRLGTFMFPKRLRWLRDAMTSVASESFTSTCAPIQYAAVRAFHGGMDIERYLRASRRVLRHLAGDIAARLKKAAISAPFPAGAFYFFLDFSNHREALARRGIRTSEALCHRLLEDTGVAILPGSDFGRPATELNARLAFVDFDGARALTEAEIIPADMPLPDDFGRIIAPNVLNAVERMCAWVERPEGGGARA